MPKKILLLFIIVSIYSSLIQSCNDQPISIPLIKDTTQLYGFNSDLVDGAVVDYKTESYQVSLYQRPKMFVGKWEDYSSTTLLRFYRIPDSLSYLTEEDIITAKLIINPEEYQFGDLDNPRLEFDVMNLVKEMDQGLEWGDVYAPDGSSNYFDESSKVSFDTTISHSDFSDSTSLDYEIDIPKSTLIRWFYLQSNYAKDTSFNTGLKTSFQLALVPTDNSNIIQRFANSNDTENSSLTPRIHIKYINKVGDTVSQNIFKAISYTLSNTTQPEENTLTIQNGYISRFYLSFNLDSIPKNKSIIRTEIKLTLNEEKSKFGSSGSDDLRISAGSFIDINTQPPSWVHNSTTVTDFTFEIPKINSLIEDYQFSNDTSITNNPLKLSFTNVKDGNNLISTNELYLFNRFVFYGIDEADESLRPKLKIIYADRASY